MAVKRKYGLIEGFYPGDDIIDCDDIKCCRTIKFKDSCFYDSDGLIYCDNCGKCVRYSRKMEEKRKLSKNN